MGGGTNNKKTFGSLYHNSPIHVKPIICHKTKKIIGMENAGGSIDHANIGELGRNKSIGMENVWSI